MASVTDLILPESAARNGDTPPRHMMVVDDAYVNYRVYASGKRINAGDGLFSLKTLRGGRDLTTIPALRGITFTAVEGETIGVVGHNGSGKSTLFRAMSGLIPTAHGRIMARERPVLLGVNAALVPELSGENNIKLGLLAMGFTAEEAAAQVDEIAEFAELNEFISHPMRTYSSGMSARLKFAIASAKAHSILLVDEALAVGDRRFRMKSEKRIRELRDSAGLVMIVSHSTNSLKDTCDRVLWIHKGELRADGDAASVIAEYVKWTKQPGVVSVGAASAAVARKQPPATAKAAVVTTSATRPIADADADIVEIQNFLENAARATSDAQTASSARRSARDQARRERYYRLVRERNRRRVITAVITAVAMILAIGAGVAFAFMSAPPRAVEAGWTSPRADATPAVSEEAADVGVGAFSAPSGIVTCATAEGEVSIPLTWDVSNAVMVSLSTAATRVDAIDDPTSIGMPVDATEYEASYPCSEASRVYTLTAEGADGTRVSADLTVTRELAQVLEEDPDQNAPRRSVVPAPPVSTDPAQPTQPADQGTVQPEPAPAPTVAPEPAPTTDPAPVPTEPAPDPGAEVTPAPSTGE